MPKQLLAGESLILPPLHRHWIVVARGLAPAVLAALIAVLLLDVLARDLLPGQFRLLGTLAVAVVLGLWTIVVLLRWAEDSLTITDQRVVLEEGVLVRTSRVIPLDRVQDVSTTQTVLGRILGYGTVAIDTAGATGSDRFVYVRRPELVRDQVFVLAGRLSRGG